VVFSQNHDQTGNRPLGERLACLIGPDRLRMAATAVILSPSIPLLFMGEEYGETAPFLYFVSHGDKDLIEAVRAGRTEEFAAFDPGGDVADPQAEETFIRSSINRELRFEEHHDLLFGFYKHLCALRNSLKPWEMKQHRPDVTHWQDRPVLCVTMPLSAGDIACFFNFSGEDTRVVPPFHDGTWAVIVDTLSEQWGGTGEKAPTLISATEGIPVSLGPWNAVVYRREEPRRAFVGNRS
jgi:maltooligosyltrehalose trehalohydrolase